MNTFTIIDSPLGGLVLVASGDKLAGVYHEYHSPEPSPVLLGSPFDPLAPGKSPVEPDPTACGAAGVSAEAAAVVFRRTTAWLNGYFKGRSADPLPYDLQSGTAFQRDVWQAVADIPYGATRTYKEVAASLGNEAMGRAIGAAVRANPLSIVIPGHRVVGSKGAVTGYAAGVAVKRALLELEAAVSESAVA